VIFVAHALTRITAGTGRHQGEGATSDAHASSPALVPTLPRKATMITIGQKFPEFELTAVIPGDLSAVDAKVPEDYFTTVSSSDADGKWKIVFFWPKDFTFVCPTEIAAFGRLNGEFVHFAWRTQHEDLKTLPFPMLADTKKELATATGVLNSDGVADRATFIIDPDGEVQFAMVTAGSVGRNVDEVLRVLDALQTDELCPCNWRKGAATIAAGELMKASA
jgi:alkyl hydroperoxide reductase subunit AhpC